MLNLHYFLIVFCPYYAYPCQKMSYALQNVKDGDKLKMYLQKMETFIHCLQLQIA